ncbi:MAG: glycosyltransferase [Candidatus Eisenbacteria bacterium]|nr:glycosyltransferase [Candidatus Eisenbacteria bacterium]
MNRPSEENGSARPIRVLYMIGNLSTGGSELHLASLLERLDRTRIEPSVLLVSEVGANVARVRSLGIEVLGLNTGKGLKGLLRAVLRIQQILRARKPDVFHLYGYTPQLYGSLGSVFARPKKVIGARRGNEVGRNRHRLFRLTNPLLDEVLCVSHATERFSVETEALSPKKSRVIPNGLDVDRFVPREGFRWPIVRVGTLGRLRHIKGSDILLDAFALVRKSRPELELHMGGPPDTAWGEELIEARKKEPGVHFHGEVKAAAFLPTLDLFVLPSRSEGMSNALIEAMAMRLPIVATDVGGNREVLDDGRCGVLTRPDPKELAEAILAALDDESGTRARVDAGRRRVEEEYDLRVMVERYMRYYEELLGRNRPEGTSSAPC